MKIVRIIDKLLNFILITFFIVIVFFAIYALYDVKQVYEDTKLSGEILKYKPKVTENKVETFDLERLQKNVNDDICGWLKVDGTNIDYPILYPDETLEYLSKGYDGKYNVGGSIFVDIKNNRDFVDDFTVIYGHNVADKLMFSDIKLFKDEEFFNKNKGGKLYTKDGIYDIKIYTFNILESNKDIAYMVDSYKNGKNYALIKNFENSAIHKNDIEISPNDKFIMLTTCNGAATTKRAVLFAKIEKSSSNDNEISGVDRDEKVKTEKKKKAELEQKIQKYKNNTEISEYKAKNSEKSSKIIEWLHEVKRFFIINMGIIYKMILFILIVITIVIYIKIFRGKTKKIDKNDDKK